MNDLSDMKTFQGNTDPRLDGESTMFSQFLAGSGLGQLEAMSYDSNHGSLYNDFRIGEILYELAPKQWTAEGKKWTAQSELDKLDGLLATKISVKSQLRSRLRWPPSQPSSADRRSPGRESGILSPNSRTIDTGNQ